MPYLIIGPDGEHLETPERPKRADRNKKPDALPVPTVYYDSSASEYPETIRLSFSDGRTVVYDRRIRQPRPRTYNNQPMRRRKG